MRIGDHREPALLASSLTRSASTVSAGEIAIGQVSDREANRSPLSPSSRSGMNATSSRALRSPDTDAGVRETRVPGAAAAERCFDLAAEAHLARVRELEEAFARLAVLRDVTPAELRMLTTCREHALRAADRDRETVRGALARAARPRGSPLVREDAERHPLRRRDAAGAADARDVRRRRGDLPSGDHR